MNKPAPPPKPWYIDYPSNKFTKKDVNRIQIYNGDDINITVGNGNAKYYFDVEYDSHGSNDSYFLVEYEEVPDPDFHENERKRLESRAKYEARLAQYEKNLKAWDNFTKLSDEQKEREQYEILKKKYG